MDHMMANLEVGCMEQHGTKPKKIMSDKQISERKSPSNASKGSYENFQKLSDKKSFDQHAKKQFSEDKQHRTQNNSIPNSLFDVRPDHDESEKV
jgi:hypothetical protein